MSLNNFLKDKLWVAPQKCLHGRHNDYRERPCQDVCPNKAIHLNPLEIAYGLCDDCGICASVCPAGALSVKESFLAEVARQAASDTGKELHIRCSRVGGRCTSVTCLGSLDYAFLDALCLRSEKDLRLLAGDCEDCGRATGGEVVRSNVDAANRFMLLFGRRERIILTESADRQDLESASRRAMFRDVGRTISKFVPEIKYPEPDIDIGAVPARMQRAIKIIKGFEEGQTRTDHDMPVPFNGKEIDAARCDICNGTPKCVCFCPTEALEYFADGGAASIIFNTRRCIGCGLCETACSERAVSSFSLRSGQIEELWHSKRLACFEADECEGCGRTSVGMRGGLCLDCQHRERKLAWESVG